VLYNHSYNLSTLDWSSNLSRFVGFFLAGLDVELKVGVLYTVGLNFSLAIIFPFFHIARICLALLLLFHSCLTAPRIRL
jgi:hypothetical protein